MKRALFSGTIPEYYDKNLGPVLFEPYAKDLVHRIKSKPRHVLELACGTGRLTQQIINEIASVTEICAIDINRDMLLAAGSKIKSPLINWLISDAQDLVFEDERFDAVICQFGIMFFPNAQKAFDEAYRVLETGGSFLFNTWDNFESNPGSRIVHKVIKDYFKMTPEFMEKAPFSFNDQLLIKAKLKQSGFKKIAVSKVKKIAKIKDVDNFINGFLKGTPLAFLFDNKKITDREKVLLYIKRELISEYGASKLSIPMQALVYQGIK